MIQSRLFLILFFLTFIFSCSSKKSIIYLQDSDNQLDYISIYNSYILKTDDVLKIDILAESPEATLQFNSGSLSPNANNTKENMIFEGYQINSDGLIYFPNLGEIKVLGLTIDELRNYIYNSIVEKGILVNPIVDVKLLNGSFTILGEVNNPGKYEFLKNNLNILEAIGIAGDLTINGKRNDLKLIRETIDGKKRISLIDLTSTDFLSGNSFQIFPGDIILVNPNSTRVKNAGIIGNSGTLLSLLSFILSLAIVVNN